MKTCVLSSGSGGNSTYVEAGNTKVLIDLGTSSLYVEKKLKEINVSPEEIDAILITHEHVDHIKGIKVFIKKYKTKLILSEILLKTIYSEIKPDNYEIIDKEMIFNDIKITAFKLSHDASDINGYLLENKNDSLVYVTDTGYLNQKNHKIIQNKNAYIFESNHDIEMLMNSKYPFHIKQRILGDYGHLSNKDSAYYLSKLVGEKTKYIVLAHLSHENNTDELALQSLEKELEKKNKKIQNIIIAHQDQRTDLIEI